MTSVFKFAIPTPYRKKHQLFLHGRPAAVLYTSKRCNIPTVKQINSGLNGRLLWNSGCCCNGFESAWTNPKSIKYVAIHVTQ